MSDDTLSIHIVSAWASENRMVLGQACLEWQKNKDKQENEIVAIPKLIEMLELEGCTVTMDAIGTQTKIVEKIAEKNADYVLAVKGNQPTLHDDIARYFEAHAKLKCLEDTDIGHGRIETRIYCLSTDLSYLSDPDSWKNLAGIVKVSSETVVKKTGEKSSETRYYITSLTKLAEAASSIRKHWEVESMHWILDVTFNENHSMKRAKESADFPYRFLPKIRL